MVSNHVLLLSFPKIVDANFCSDGFGPLLEQMVQSLCRHVSDDSPTVRRLCLRGLVQVFLVTEYSFSFLLVKGGGMFTRGVSWIFF